MEFSFVFHILAPRTMQSIYSIYKWNKHLKK
jgi:hypothetical protein